MSGGKLRFIIRFLDAGWRMDEVARLFDVSEADIRHALVNGVRS